MLDAREVNITACGLLKSIIKSGAESGKDGSNWQELLKYAMNVHSRTVRIITEPRKKEVSSNANRN